VLVTTVKCRATVEQPRPDKHPENLNDILTKALERKAYDLRSSNIEVEADLSPDLPTILLDAPQLQQVFLHVLNNACQAMADYGTTRKLCIQTSQCGQNLRVEIADTGPGIAPEHLQHVFTPFFTTKSQGKGMGLGLSIARDLIRAHHGTVSVQSQGGEGTTVVMELPLAIP
jgi:two-component system, NtrC family, sensor kinase